MGWRDDIEFRKRVAQASQELGRAGGKADIEKAVETVRFTQMRKLVLPMTEAQFRKQPVTGDQKNAVTALANAVTKLRRALRNDHVPLFIDDQFDDEALEKTEAELKSLKRTKLLHTGRRDAVKLLAAKQAKELLEARGLSTAIRSKQFNKLAAILYGDPRAKMRNYLIAAKKKPARKSSTVPDWPEK